MKDSITSLIGLKDDEVESIVMEEKNNEICIYVTLTNHGVRCPNCGHFTTSVHSYYTKKIVHSIFNDKKCLIIYRSRRFICSNPKCKHTIFEHNPFCSQYANISDRTVEIVLEKLKMVNETFTSVAKEVFLSPDEVSKIFDEHVQMPRNRLSPIMAIDEFYFSRTRYKKFAVMLLNLEKMEIIDIIPDRTKPTLDKYFSQIPSEERELVRYVSMDMYATYRNAIYQYFPKAIVCVDTFHIKQHVNDALNAVCIRVMKRYESDTGSHEYYLLKYQRDLLFKDFDYVPLNQIPLNKHFHARLSDKRLLDFLLGIDKQIHLGYDLKFAFDQFEDVNYKPDDKEELLNNFIERCYISCIPEFMKVGQTCDNWKKEILNSFAFYKRKKIIKNEPKVVNCRVTSSPIEGMNRFVKQILLLSNGYVNFDRARNSILYKLNKNSTPSKTKLKNKIRRRRR